MKISKNKSKLYEDDGKPISSLRIDIELDSDSPMKDHEWLMERISYEIDAFNERKREHAEAESKYAQIPHHKKCPITKQDVDGSINWKQAIELNLITPEERSAMRSKAKKNNTFEGSDRFIDYNNSYCTIPYTKTLTLGEDNDKITIPKKHKKITIKL